MSANQALWEKGDFTRLADCMRDSGAALVAELGVGVGLRMLDLGCGDGTTAIPAARLGADVRGIDIARNLVAAGNRRAAAAGLSNCRFEEGDASNLENVADDQFDMVLTMFGAMFAPNPEAVAREMVRVTRSGGRIVMGNWIPGDPTLIAQVLRISSAYAPPAPGSVSPMTWGDREVVKQRFAGAGVPEANVSFSREIYEFRFEGAASAYVDLFRTFYGPTMNAYAAAEAVGKGDAFVAELVALFETQNASGDPQQMRLPAAYLQVRVEVP